MERIVLLSTGCTKCKILESILDRKKISYEVISDPERIKDLGFVEVPVLNVGETYYDFNEAVKWANNRG